VLSEKSTETPSTKRAADSSFCQKEKKPGKRKVLDDELKEGEGERTYKGFVWRANSSEQNSVMEEHSIRKAQVGFGIFHQYGSVNCFQKRKKMGQGAPGKNFAS